MAKNRKYYVISPNVNSNNEEQRWIDFISKNGYACMGWSEEDEKAPIFHKQMKKGDVVIIAAKSNANKKVVGFGFVNSNVESGQLDGMPTDCFYRKLEPFVTKKEILQKLREAIKEVAPNATEKLSCKIPTYWDQVNLVQFAVNKNHLGFYPFEEAVAFFANQITEAGYTYNKGCIQIPWSKPIDYNLIKQIVIYRTKMVKK